MNERIEHDADITLCRGWLIAGGCYCISCPVREAQDGGSVGEVRVRSSQPKLSDEVERFRPWEIGAAGAPGHTVLNQIQEPRWDCLGVGVRGQPTFRPLVNLSIRQEPSSPHGEYAVS